MRNFLIIVIALFLTACGSGIPKVKPFKLDIQQGNVITSEMLLKLKPGMTKSQVRYILGTPLIQDSFHGNRWDYFYQYEKGGKLIERRDVYLTFEKNLLDKIAGDVVLQGAPGAVAPLPPKPKGTRVVKPAAVVKKKGFFDNWKFWKKDEVPADGAIEAAASAESVVEEAPIVLEAEEVKVKQVEVDGVKFDEAEVDVEMEVIGTPKVATPAAAPIMPAPEERGYVLKKTEVQSEAEQAKKRGFFSWFNFWDHAEDHEEPLSPARIEETQTGFDH